MGDSGKVIPDNRKYRIFEEFERLAPYYSPEGQFEANLIMWMQSKNIGCEDLFHPQEYANELDKFMNIARRQVLGFEEAVSMAVIKYYKPVMVSQLERVREIDKSLKKSDPLEDLEMDEQVHLLVRALCLEFAVAIMERVCQQD